MKLDSETVRRIYAEWSDREPRESPTFGGPDGNLYFAHDAEFWRLIDRAVEGWEAR